ncbi:MAG: hypothetical protein M3Q07_28630 [Pseudobdellovibrionaceae bacterium]|nr:hypothetical protein [Pseudobdellovibrionaceae bacterium]
MQAFLLAAALANPTPATEAKTILKAIDNICGDTWCEGDFSYRFNKVILNPTNKSTRVLFTMSINDAIEIDANTSIVKQKFDVSCTVTGYSTFSEIMTSNDTLNWDFYTGLGDCIQKLEGRLSKVNRAE